MSKSEPSTGTAEKALYSVLQPRQVLRVLKGSGQQGIIFLSFSKVQGSAVIS